MGQLKTKTEYEYLKLTNLQQNKVLIKNNLRGTRELANRLVELESDKYASLYLDELASSYRIIGNSQMTFYFLLMQRCLFPNDALSAYQKNNFFESAYSSELSENTARDYWKNTQKAYVPEEHCTRITLFLELTTQLYNDDLTQPIYEVGLILRKKKENIAAWYQRWEFLTTIGFDEKAKKEILADKTLHTASFYKYQNKKIQAKIYRKAIRHYLKTDAHAHAKELMVDYQKQDLSFIYKIDLIAIKMKHGLK